MAEGHLCDVHIKVCGQEGAHDRAERFGAIDAPGGLHDEFRVAFGKGQGEEKVLGVSNDEMSLGTELAKRGKIEVLGQFRDLVL